MSQISREAATLIGAFLECIMYGIFVPLFIAACYVQWEKVSNGRGINYVMVFATVFFGCTVTADCVLTLDRVLNAVLYIPSGTSPYQYLIGPWPAVEIARFSILQSQTVVADIIMIYRMFHIYDRNFSVCILPSITTAALFSTACGLMRQLSDPSVPPKLEVRDHWSMASFSLAIFNSLFMTVAISVRLWGVHQGTAKANIQPNGSIVFRTMRVLIEGAALWTTFVVVNFCSYLARSNFTLMFLRMISPAAGISFCMIIVRLGHILPEMRDESWEISIRAPQRPQRSEQLVAPFSRVEIQREVYVEDSRDFLAEALVTQKREYVNPTDDLQKVSPIFSREGAYVSL